MRYFKILSSAVFLASGALASAACSSDSTTPTPPTGGGGGCTHFDYSKYTPATTPTFAGGVSAYFATTCASAPSCHLKGMHPPNLGGGTTTPDMVRAAIVGVTSTEVASMKYVVAGDPQNSWLMRKMEDANPGCGLTCVNPTGFADGCSTQMPSGVPPVATEIAMIRDWIKNGAM